MNPVRAAPFRELRQRCAGMPGSPASIPCARQFGSGVRVAVHGSYVILYPERAGSVVIERVVHGARDLGDISL